MAYDAFRRQVVLFGGYDGSGDRDDTWIWDGEDWTEQHPAHTPPSNSIFGMAFDAGTRTIVMNGGSAFVFYTTWLWDGSDWLTGHTRAPRWRQLQGMSPDGDGAVMFGGETDDLEGIRVPSNTTFTWDGTKWMLRKPTRHPTFRVGSGMAYDVARDQVILFGGADYGPLDDTWWWTGDTWRELHPRTSPEGRERMGMAYDSAHQQIVVFGGTQDLDDCFFGDTWIWDGVTWTEH